MELQCNLALRWLVGLNLDQDQDAWDASTYRRVPDLLYPLSHPGLPRGR